MADGQRLRRTSRRRVPDAEGRLNMTRYTREAAEQIAEWRATGESWASICRRPDVPSHTTLFRWRKKHPDFAEMLAQAREMVAEVDADTALEVAENTTAETLAKDRLRVSTLQWRSDRALKGQAKSDGEGRVAPRLIVEVRRFEKVVGPDGVTTVRPIPRRRPR